MGSLKVNIPNFGDEHFTSFYFRTESPKPQNPVDMKFYMK